MAEAADPYASWPDDRVSCESCARCTTDNRRGTLLCHAWLGSPDMHGQRYPLAMIDTVKRRCFFFRPRKDNPDQRSGRDRWPCTDEEEQIAHRRRMSVYWRWMDAPVDKPKRRA